MDRYADMFERLDQTNEGAFVPFVTVGDPNQNTSIDIMQCLIDNGADALELGIPYSDPIADGPTIQHASIRALGDGATPDTCFAAIARIRKDNPTTPIGLLLYSNLVMVKGLEAFYQDAANAGVDSILIADVPLREATPFIEVANRTGIKQILIAPPNATDETFAAIGEQSQGYTYLLGRSGVTGAETAAEIPAETLIKKLQAHKVAPPLLGFGISKPQQVKDAIAAGAAGAISGSATVNIIAEHLDNKTQMLECLGQFVKDMKAATTL